MTTKNKPALKNSPEKKLVIKESYKKTETKKLSLKTSYLIVMLFFCVLFSLIILTIILSQPKITTPTPPKPHQLSTITDNQEIFVKIKNSLLENISTEDILQNSCPQPNLFNIQHNQTAYAYNKFLVILKRGKLFVTDTTNNKFISYTEISPYPTKENNCITYHNIIFKDGNLIIIGYRKEAKTLEISIFPINKYGTITRGKVYNLPSSECYISNNLTNNQFTFYTSRKLTSTSSLDTINTINVWNNKTNQFTTKNTSFGTIFYDNNSSLDNPLIHTFTTCQLNKATLENCQQQHIIDNPILDKFTNISHFYFWTTQDPLKDNPGRIMPNSKIYKVDPQNSTIAMIQAEGLPISTNSLSIDNQLLSTFIYQNNNTAPAWHTTFTPLKVATFKIDLIEFQPNGNFINNPNNYTVTSYTLNNLQKNEIPINDTNKFITINSTNSTINLHTDTKQSITIDGKILNTKSINDLHLLLIFYQKKETIFAQIIDTQTNTLSEKLIIRENIKSTITIPTTEIKQFKIQNDTFISASFLEEPLNKGTINLFKISKNTLEKAYSLPFKKTHQRINDGCQNDCQQDWKTSNNFFPASTSKDNKIIYATIGSWLKKFTISNNKVILLKTFNYTYLPLTPRQKAMKIARKPVSAAIVNGKYVCKKKEKDEYIGKSRANNKGYVHLDLECCLDPDEFPNPWCSYRPGELSRSKYKYSDYTYSGKRIDL